MGLGRIDHLVLRAGARPESGPRSVMLGPVTVLVGPNNGGKSTTLQDVTAFVSRGGSQPTPPWEGGTVVEWIGVQTPETREEVIDFLAPRTIEINEHAVAIRSFTPGAQGPGMAGDGALNLPLHELDPTAELPEHVAIRLLGAHMLSLNGRQRFDLAAPVQSGNLDGPPNSHWMAVEREDQVYNEVDAMVYAAFEQHLIVTTFRPPQLQPALSPAEMPEGLRQSTNAEAVAYQKQAVPLEELSDGVQVFCGLTAAVAALPHLLLLIDEPEAFLHPTLCRRLGSNLARIAKQRDARLITATHSAEFLLGCLEQVPETTVLRLDYRGGIAASHALDAARVSELSRDPLLRSVDALHALFTRSAVICEADADRAFYEEINRRLLGNDGRDGALDSAFLNAQNWQTTVRIASPLRTAGVPAALILDLDTLANDDAWPEIVQMAQLPQDRRDEVLQARATARDVIIARGRPAANAPLAVKLEGLAALEGEDRAAVEVAIEHLAAIGVFVVTVGELENWLSQFGCTNKQTWVTDMLQRLGAPEDPAYVTPGPGDVWEFVEAVARWLEDPTREGMPSD